MSQKSVDLVAVLAQAGQVELDAIGEQVAKIQAEIDTRKADISSLKLVARVIKTKLSPRAKPGPKRKAAGEGGAKKSGGTELQKQIYDLLAKEGSMPVPTIAAKLGMEPQRVGRSIYDHPWFIREFGEVKIAKTRT